MRNLAALAVALVSTFLAACGSDVPPSCGQVGRSAACACPGGTQGAQECGPFGAWSICACPGAADAAPEAGADAAQPADAPVAAEAGADALAVADAATDAPTEASACPAGWGECSPGACVSLATTAAHCGRCGAACSPSWRCERGTCVSPSGVSCDPGQADCDRNEGNGCESALRVDHVNCGACGNNCRTRGLFCREGACAP
jgi:hypothetical protein